MVRASSSCVKLARASSQPTLAAQADCRASTRWRQLVSAASICANASTCAAGMLALRRRCTSCSPLPCLRASRTAASMLARALAPACTGRWAGAAGEPLARATVDASIAIAAGRRAACDAWPGPALAAPDADAGTGTGACCIAPARHNSAAAPSATKMIVARMLTARLGCRAGCRRSDTPPTTANPTRSRRSGRTGRSSRYSSSSL